MPNIDPRSGSSRVASSLDRRNADRQLHFLREGHKRGLGFAELRQLVAQFYGSEIKPCQLQWVEIDRLIIELWRQDLRKDSQTLASEVISLSRWRAKNNTAEVAQADETKNETNQKSR